jgi:hypothetical protein
MSEFDPTLIYYLKGSTLRRKFERLKFGLLTCAREERGMSELEILEFDMLLDQVFGTKDPSWVRVNANVANAAKELYELLLKSENPETRKRSVKDFLTKNYFLKIHNAHYGRLNQNPVETLLLRRNRMEKVRVRPKRFIGVGYKDKGNKRNFAEDGTPQWETVYNPNEEREAVLSPMQKQFLGAVFGNFREHFHHEADIKDPKDLPKNPFLKIGGLNARGPEAETNGMDGGRNQESIVPQNSLEVKLLLEERSARSKNSSCPNLSVKTEDPDE